MRLVETQLRPVEPTQPVNNCGSRPVIFMGGKVATAEEVVHLSRKYRFDSGTVHYYKPVFGAINILNE